MTKKLLVSLSLIGLSLSYFSIRATLLCYTSLALLYLLNSEKLKNITFKTTWINVLILINIFVLVFSVRHEIYFNSYIKFFLFSTYTMLFLALINNDLIKKGDLVFSCKAYIAMHSTAFIVQLATYQVSGYFIDFDSHIREQSSQVLYQTKALEDLFINIRATGLYSEPSFYAMSVLPLSVLLSLYLKKVTMLTFIGICTSAASLSIAAILITSASILLLITQLKNNRLYILIMITLFIGSMPVIHTVYERRIVSSIDYDAVSSRQQIFNEFQIRPLSYNISGGGFFWDENKPIGFTSLNGYHTRDSSFYVYLFFTSGFIGLLTFIFCIYYCLRSCKKYTVAASIFFLFKLHVLSGSLWLIIIAAFAFHLLDKKKVTSDCGVNALN